MKQILFVLCLLATHLLSAQLQVGTGASLVFSGNITLTVSGMNLNNQGTIVAGAGSVIQLDGSVDQSLRTNGSTLQILVLNKTAGQVNLLDNATILANLNFATPGGRISLGNNDLVLGSAATVTGFGANAFVVTGGAGEIAKQGLNATPFTFPVGNNTTTYNPLTLAENGTADEIGVRCLAGPLANGATGTPIATDMANTAWEVTEATAGGSNLSATAQWIGTDELPGFSRATCGIARYNTGIDWDLRPANMGAAGGADPYTRTSSNLAPGILTVADDAFMNQLLITPKILLAGPYVAAADLMYDSLRILPGFPLSAPATYGTGKYVHAGFQPVAGYTIAPAVLAVTGANAIVDWVFLWLKDPANPATNLQTRVALLQRDGDVVDMDGVSPVKMPGNATQNYILGIGHRNHLSVRSPDGAGLNFNESSATVYDFTTAQSKAFGTNPMRQIDTAPLAFGLIAGNANGSLGAGNINVKYNGSTNDRNAVLNIVGIATPNAIIIGYYNEDVNLDAKVKYNGSVSDRNVILSTVGIATPNAIITEQF